MAEEARRKSVYTFCGDGAAKTAMNGYTDIYMFEPDILACVFHGRISQSGENAPVYGCKLLRLIYTHIREHICA